MENSAHFFSILMAQSKDVEPRFRKKNTRNLSLCRSLISGQTEVEKSVGRVGRSTMLKTLTKEAAKPAVYVLLLEAGNVFLEPG